MRRRKKFEGMTLQQKLASMTPGFGARYLDRRRKIRDERDLYQSVLGQTYLRNSPVERDEVSIRNGQIRTLPINACVLDENGFPRLVDHLFEELVEELTREWKAKEETLEERQLKVGLAMAQLLEDAHREAKPGLSSPWCPRQCRACGKWFFCAFGHTRMRFCSDRCIAAGEKTVISGYVARRSATRQRGRSTKCAHCGASMEAARSSRKFCSPRCRVAAFRAAPKEEIDLAALGLL
jgi:hypothetical protein